MKNTKINITFEQFTIHQLMAATVIRSCIKAALRQELVQVPCEINVLVTNNSGIRGINRVSRKIDKATDVLSFPMFSFEAGNPPADWSAYMDPETGLCPLGDIAISLEQAILQAKEYGHTLRREIGYLTIHSMLHLLGYDHVDEAQEKAKMRKREEQIAATVSGLRRD